MPGLHSPPAHWLAGALLVALLLLVFQAVVPASFPGGDEVMGPDGVSQMHPVPGSEGFENRPAYLTGPTGDYAPTESEHEILRLDIDPTAGQGFEVPRVEDSVVPLR